MKIAKDFRGQEFTVGQQVVRACVSGSSPYLNICEVTKIEDGKVYLDHSPQALVHTNRVMILSQGEAND